MKLTQASRDILQYRRSVRKLTNDGYEEIGEGGGKLWELYRGWRHDHVITDVVIGPDRKALFIKTAPKEAA
jgi:hypothetical protein